MSRADGRFVVPVYQRPYSWEEEQCLQLWDDVLSIGRRKEGQHFTGSVVWIQEGVMSAAGVTPTLLIDGQQRMATLTLLLIALAGYARDHTAEDLDFSYDGIISDGLLLKMSGKGDDRYKLILSHGDRPTLCSLIDNLVDPDVPVDDGSSRLVENLATFRDRLEDLSDPSSIWMGIHRLEVVSVSLAQGQDNPQLIFESMNSTGKDLSSADLIRNFVLMGLPMDQQERVYANHWRKIEEALGADSYDTVFDDFIRNYLTVLYAPESLVKRDVYSTFKRHVVANGYDKDDRIVGLLREMETYARYYAAITGGDESDSDLRVAFARIARLDASVVNPLLLSLCHDRDLGAITRDDLLGMLSTLESYLMRRAVCDIRTAGLNKYLPSLIARLDHVREEGGDCRKAFEAYLMAESVNSSSRFPSDAEFRQALGTRDSYHFKKSFYLLSRLENSYHPKDERDFAKGSYTIEHILPQNALAHAEWRQMLGEDCEETFGRCVNNLGNLTLTAYNSELSDGTFAEKKARTEGGYDNEFITISSDLRDASRWDETSIRNRGVRLVERALGVWPAPMVSDEVRARYAVEQPKAGKLRTASFQEVFASGRLKPGDVLTSASSGCPVTATVTDAGAIRLSNGEEFASPSAAAAKAIGLSGKTGSRSRNGWVFWRVGEDGPLLDELRSGLVGRSASSSPDGLV
ncbi:MAG: DUF262 domain-containing protein [Atopobiaceae bacterium]|nr:DUF262 domain-containing protein [Atopobiaceae bacterium]